MLAAQHVKSGVVAGLGVVAIGAEWMNVARLADVLLFPAIAAGAALVPDADIPGSTFTRFFPPITYPLHWLFVWLHRLTYHMTRRPHDPPSRSVKTPVPRRRFGVTVAVRPAWRTAHRGLTHGWPFAVVVAGVAAGCAHAGPWWVSTVIVGGLVLLAGRSILAPAVLLAYVSVTAIELGPIGLALHVQSLGWWWAVAVLVGLIAHDLGDCPTTAGVPLHAPFTWRLVKSPVPFRTGGTFELVVVRWVLIVMIAYLAYVVVVRHLAG